MKNLALLAALMGGMAVAGGCQMSGDRHVDTNDRPAAYNYAYTATKDTDWRSSTASDATSGTIPHGTTVYFDRAPDTTSTWQQARVQDGSVRYVRTGDYRMNQ